MVRHRLRCRENFQRLSKAGGRSGTLFGGVYERFGLSGFDQLRRKLTAYFEAKKSYRPNRHELPPALAERIERECGDYMQQFGYTEPVEA